MTRRSRYPSDTSNAQWALIEPLLPAPHKGGRPEKHPRRAVVDAILYVVRTGCSWRQLPGDFPPWQTVYWYFNQWEQAKTTDKILPVVREQLRVQEGRDPEPSAGLIDSQSVKGADTVGADTRGYDAGKKVKGRKRFITTDTLGLLLCVVVCSARVQDRDGAKSVLLDTRLRTRVRFLFADGGFARPAGRLGGDDPGHHRAGRAQTRWPARVRGDPAPLGGRADLRLAHRPPPPGPRLRTRPQCLRGHDPVGRDQHHHPPRRPRRPSHPTATPPAHAHYLIFPKTP